jgi:tungstate transport system ATP-binding protein
MNDCILEGRNVQVLYEGRLALAVAEIGVHRGETLAVIGPNGAGKSTLLRILGLLERPASGQILLDSQLVAKDADLLALRRRFASVFQDPLLIEGTVERNVGLGLQLRRMAQSAASERIRLWMQRFGIEGLASRQASSLSGGEAQRVSLARAFAIEPDILLLDEPFAALDPLTREMLLRDLHRILRESGVTCVFVTHDRDEAQRLGDRVAVVMDGRLQQVGTPEEVFGRPISESVARFVGVDNLLAGQVTADHEGLLAVDVGSFSVRASGRIPVGSPVIVCLRPEDLVLQSGVETDARDGALNHLPGRVTGLFLTGSQYRVEVDCGHPLVALVTKHCVQALWLAPLSEVLVDFKPSAAHLIVKQES